jgi:drug/metabolite transporter (DMT)-like permease
MSVPAAFVGVILIWATTPLAIKWSGEGVGFLFGVTARFVLGLGAVLALLALLRQPLPRHRTARRVYLAGGVSLALAMLLTYWAAQRVPSGWVSVVFGLTPLVTGLMAARWLGEESLTPTKLAGMLLGVIGLALIFAEGRNAGEGAVAGVAALLLAVASHSAGAVAVKRMGAHLPALPTTAGGLLVATPLLAVGYGAFGSPWPLAVSPRTGAAIVYLGLVGSVLGFILYYHVLRRVEASRVALITLVTPVMALLLGHLVAGEPLPPGVWLGTGAILAGLGLYQVRGRRRLAPAPVTAGP